MTIGFIIGFILYMIYSYFIFKNDILSIITIFPITIWACWTGYYLQLLPWKEILNYKII